MKGPYTTIEVADWNKVMGEVKRLQVVAEAAQAFLAQITCYSTGVSVLQEEDMKPLHDALVRAIATARSA